MNYDVSKVAHSDFNNVVSENGNAIVPYRVNIIKTKIYILKFVIPKCSRSGAIILMMSVEMGYIFMYGPYLIS